MSSSQFAGRLRHPFPKGMVFRKHADSIQKHPGNGRVRRVAVDQKSCHPINNPVRKCPGGRAQDHVACGGGLQSHDTTRLRVRRGIQIELGAQLVLDQLRFRHPSHEPDTLIGHSHCALIQTSRTPVIFSDRNSTQQVTRCDEELCFWVLGADCGPHIQQQLQSALRIRRMQELPTCLGYRLGVLLDVEPVSGNDPVCRGGEAEISKIEVALEVREARCAQGRRAGRACSPDARYRSSS